MKNSVKIKKYSGELVDFDEEKLIRSLRHAGAGEARSLEITSQVKKALFDGISTQRIYSMAFQLLKQDQRAFASRYKTKKAIMELGPSGFPFEQFIRHIFDHDGYSTQSGVFLQGNCATHEVDVIASKENLVYLVECKYHNTQGKVSDIKIPLYVQSRFTDIVKNHRDNAGGQKIEYQGWIVTNTRFTLDAQQYGKCIGLQLVSWDHPETKSLRDRINRSRLFPITALTTLTRREKSNLLAEGIVLCKELQQNTELLDKLGLSRARRQKVITDLFELCKK